MTLQQIITYIELNWEEITDPNHAAQMVLRMQDKHAIDTILGFYVRYI